MNNLWRVSLATTGWNILGKAAGFLVPFAVAAVFGAGAATDAFFYAYGLALLAAGILAPVLEGVIVPCLKETEQQGGDPARLVGAVLGRASAGLLLATALFLPLVTPLLSLATRFDPETIRLSLYLLAALAPLVVLLAATSVTAGALNAGGSFALPAFSPAIRAGLALAVIFLFRDRAGIYAVALGYSAGETARFFLLFALLKKRFLPDLRFSLAATPDTRRFFKAAGYQAVGMAALAFNPVVDRTMASWLAPGSVSLLYYADRLFFIPVTVFSGGVMVVLLTRWSERYQRAGYPALRREVTGALARVGALGIALAILLAVFHRPLAHLFLNRGAFPAASVPEVGRAWLFYLAGLAPWLVKMLLGRGLLVLKRTPVLMRAAFINVTANAGLNLLLMRPLGLAGLALSTSLVSVLTAAYLAVHFYRHREKG